MNLQSQSTEFLSSRQTTILVVDDSAENLALLHQILNPRYQVRLINSGVKALEFLSREKVDLILMDVVMPAMDGYEVCQRIRKMPNLQLLPILFITSKNTPEDEQQALKMGGNDFISKPINPDVLLARVETHLKLKFLHDLMVDQNKKLEAELQTRLSDIFKLQEASLAVMISLAEFRDECTGNHISRTQKYVVALAQEAQVALPHLGLHSRRIELIGKCAPLHDVGKITTPDHILLKPGPLTPEEFEVMKLHVIKGWEILETAAKSMGYYGEFLRKAQEIVISHHEKWDGTGYPKGLRGTDIPVSGRLMAIADIYDALRSSRPYKKAFSHEESIAIMQKMSSQHFDPELFECFMRIEPDIIDISERYSDVALEKQASAAQILLS